MITIIGTVLGISLAFSSMIFFWYLMTPGDHE